MYISTSQTCKVPSVVLHKWSDFLGSILGIPPMICGALGYAAVFGSATNTLIAPILIGLEVFGTRNTIPLILVCILAYLVNGNHSIYGAQQKALCRFEEDVYKRQD